MRAPVPFRAAMTLTATALVLSFPLDLPAAEPARGPVAPSLPGARQVLFGFGQGFDLGSVGKTDSEVSLSPDGRLAVRTGTSARWPGIALRAPGGSWDLSRRLFVAATVANRGADEATLHLRVDNPGADGTKSCVTGSVRLRPGESGTLRVNLTPTPWRLSKALGLIGMRAAPGTAERLDPSNVTQLLFFVASPRAAHSFEIAEVTAGGEATFLDAETFFPFIDTFGQFAHAHWPGKTRSLEALRAGVAEEDRDLAANPGPPGRGAYGGWAAGPKLEATGFFRVAKHGGKWWLVDPEGYLFWSHGVDCVRAQNPTPITDRERYFADLPGPESILSACYGTGSWAPHNYYEGRGTYRTFDFGAANRIRKYGEDWARTFAELCHRRLRSWGMNTIANWSDAAVYRLRKTPYTATISFSSRPIEGSEGYWGKFPDPFDPTFRTALRKRLDADRDSFAGDPWCIGIFVHNELGWGDELSLALGALASGADQPAKAAFVAELEAKHGAVERLNEAWGTAHASWGALLEAREKPDRSRAAEDLKSFSSRIAEAYFGTIRDELRKVAPRQLYLGCRFAWANERAVRAAAAHCDVVSFNRYDDSVEDLLLPEGIDLPAIIGEFHFGALDRGMFHTGLRPTASQEHRAAAYASYVEGALRNPHIVGTHWFQFQDQPTTGRGDGENYQIGLVDICDVPHPETILASRLVGRDLYRFRLEDILFREHFFVTPEGAWSWVRPNPPNVRIDRGLAIRLEPGGLMGGGKDAKNILIRPIPEGARAASVSVETDHRSQFEQAGLILYRDDDNYVKLVREFVDGATWVVLVVETEARARVLAKVPVPQGRTRLGLDFTERGAVALTWGDAGDAGDAGARTGDVVRVGEPDFPWRPAPRIGVFTQSGQAGADRWARFSEFALRSRPIGEGP